MPTVTGRLEKIERICERRRRLDQEIVDLLAHLTPDEAERILCEVAQAQGIE